MPNTSSAKLEDSAELEQMYSRFGWKWAVLAYTAARVLERGKCLPKDVVQHLTTARTKMESGCHSTCDMAADLRNLEIKLFPAVLHVSEGEVHTMLELVGKTMNGTIQEKDIDLSPLKPMLADCTLPKACFR